MNDVLISVRIGWSRLSLILRIKALHNFNLRVVLIKHELGQVNQLMLQKKGEKSSVSLMLKALARAKISDKLHSFDFGCWTDTNVEKVTYSGS